MIWPWNWNNKPKPLTPEEQDELDRQTMYNNLMGEIDAYLLNQDEKYLASVKGKVLADVVRVIWVVPFTCTVKYVRFPAYPDFTGELSNGPRNLIAGDTLNVTIYIATS